MRPGGPPVSTVASATKTDSVDSAESASIITSATRTDSLDRTDSVAEILRLSPKALTIASATRTDSVDRADSGSEKEGAANLDCCRAVLVIASATGMDSDAPEYD
jgi:hypothetical protein